MSWLLVMGRPNVQIGVAMSKEEGKMTRERLWVSECVSDSASATDGGPLLGGPAVADGMWAPSWRSGSHTDRRRR